MSRRARLMALVRGPDGRALGLGLVSGFAAGAVMVLVTVLLRIGAGIPLPTELVSDRFLPFVPVGRFLDMLDRLGGAIQAKQIGYFSAFAAQLAHRARARRGARPAPAARAARHRRHRGASWWSCSSCSARSCGRSSTRATAG